MEKNGSTPEWIYIVANWFGDHLSEIGIAIAAFIITSVFALILHKKATIGKQISYQLKDFRLLGYDDLPLPDAIEIRFDGIPVDKLNRAVLILWNSGRDTIRGSEIVDADRLRLLLNESFILDAKVVTATRDIIGAKLGPSTGEVEKSGPRPGVVIDFDFLDKGDGIVIEVLHAPESVDREGVDKDAAQFPCLNGTIRGIPDGPRQLGWQPNLKFGEDIIAPAVSAVGVLGIAIFNLVYAFHSYSNSEWWTFTFFSLASTAAFLFSLLPFFIFLVRLRIAPQNRCGALELIGSAFTTFLS